MTPLPLSGTARSIVGGWEPGRRVLRLRAGENGSVGEADAAIVRHGSDLTVARDRDFTRAVIFEPCLPIEPGDFVLTAHLDQRFGYLADGDVIALDPASRRFRVLFRRASKNNTILVTERCNHYCLTCSQPPPKRNDVCVVD